jgi:hypothetical protein
MQGKKHRVVLDAFPCLSVYHYTLSLVFDRLDIPSSSTTELSELGRDFFTRLFERSDKVNVP